MTLEAVGRAHADIPQNSWSGSLACRQEDHDKRKAVQVACLPALGVQRAWESGSVAVFEARRRANAARGFRCRRGDAMPSLGRSQMRRVEKA